MSEQAQLPLEAPASPAYTVDQLNDLSKQVLAGKEFSEEEYAQIIRAYHRNRLNGVESVAAKTGARAASKAATAPKDLASILAAMKGAG